MNARHRTSAKYERARELVRLTDAWLPNYSAAVVYAALERRGYTWHEQQQKWTHEEVLHDASER